MRNEKIVPLWQDCEAVLAADGQLAQQLPGYQPRVSQLKMAEAICTAIECQQNLVVEAGTGTGKTFAYLIPVLLSGLKTIISTGTKNLQDQLFFRDLPFMQSILQLPLKKSILKGRSHYLCRHRIEQAETYEAINSQDRTFLTRVIEQLPRLKHGEITEIKRVPEDATIWPWITSTVDNCLNQECAHYDQCFLMKARRKAQVADIIVVNHHLFFADAVIKQDEMGELLPEVHTVIFDEAHQLPETASRFYGRHFSKRQWQLFFKDVHQEWAAVAADQDGLPETLLQLDTLLQTLHQLLGRENVRSNWQIFAAHPTWIAIREQIVAAFALLLALLEQLSERSKGLEQCYLRGLELVRVFRELTELQQQHGVYWYETYTRGFNLCFTPLSTVAECQQLYSTYAKAWIFTSATLAVGSTLEHFSQSMGVNTATQLCLSSPFDYQKQALLYLPRYMPDPKSPHYPGDIVEAAKPIIEHLGGRTLILFTSYTALHQTASLLQARLDMPLLMQGQMPKQQLITAFMTTQPSVLLATQSFWEGVDIKGPVLSCVIIDKLPFSTPDDPVLQARIMEMRAKGQDPFFKYQLPKAALSLKQGAGRLIRDINDSGILMICDPRLISREYGPWLLANLPPMPRTRDLSRVLTTLESMVE